MVKYSSLNYIPQQSPFPSNSSKNQQVIAIRVRIYTRCCNLWFDCNYLLIRVHVNAGRIVTYNECSVPHLKKNVHKVAIFTIRCFAYCRRTEFEICKSSAERCVIIWYLYIVHVKWVELRLYRLQNIEYINNRYMQMMTTTWAHLCI